MNDIDQRIQAALRGHTDGESLAPDPHIAEEVIATFHGRSRLLNILTVVFTPSFILVLIWAAVHFFEAETVTMQLRWGGLALLCFLMVSFLKLWFWLEMQSNRLLRELKRVELLLLTRLPGK